ncbi:alpha-amylase family glycosyl hydrolase [Leptothoe sp. PORK10 BA2]|uniref:alpha-amylase family glycosyl hydrolase n=1 Tax=Leptothoe sp. PORK10 BA2 TaxID=3110254 RepID=UPI002B21F07A|nr:alpha-amylase family glycosyl hydrolase [Leptothoe sp. PORK10 BA2]MEA5465777.1 alpha-amylase family glycosyl hydrolase [Leptothoe sp. PORK10 BA2]
MAQSCSKTPWWKGAVIYEIYIRSFYANPAITSVEQSHEKDGSIGTLLGIVDKLDYIQTLGVDAIWITPFYKSPMRDFGYDVEDYYEIDQRFGTIEHFKHLIDEAHKRDLKVVVDQVWGHTSIDHKWFKSERQNLVSEECDSSWYVWQPSKPDGMPPNNWFSFFGGSAWTWDSEVDQYYLHHFLDTQPALNLHNPEVTDELLRISEFWLDLGVDGFRLDAVPFWMHDPAFTDNQPRAKGEAPADGFSRDLPSAKQRQTYNVDHENLLRFLTEFRKSVDSRPDAEDRSILLMAEVAAEKSIEVAAKYSQKDRLHTAYNFALLKICHNANEVVQTVRAALESLESKEIGADNTCWCIGNHDVQRIVSRWGSYAIAANKSDRFAKLVMSLHLSLPGSICIYQGEELGLPQAQLNHDQLKDPYDKALGDKQVGRDGARTVMPWEEEEPYFGFSKERPWLDLPNNLQEYTQRTVDGQQENVNSVLHSYRKFLAWRKQNRSTIIHGDFRLLRSIEEPLLAFSLECDAGEELLFVYNFSLRKSRFLLRNYWYECIPLKDEDSFLKDLDFVMGSQNQVGSAIILEPLSFYLARIPAV